MDFANILFGGPCNRRCWFCIGGQLPERVRQNNLDLFPPRNLDGFLEAVLRHGVRQVVFTGTTTDPQLYRHEARLLAHLRERLPPETVYSLHTNGARALRQTDTFNLYDKVCLSFPSFTPEIYKRMMGSPQVPDLGRILEASRIPVKVSCLVTDDNEAQLSEFLARCRALGVPRLVLRRLYGDHRPWTMPCPRVGDFRGNPIYDWEGMEVTCWCFEESQTTSLNLFPDGTLGDSYLLARTF